MLDMELLKLLLVCVSQRMLGQLSGIICHHGQYVWDDASYGLQAGEFASDINLASPYHLLMQLSFSSSVQKTKSLCRIGLLPVSFVASSNDILSTYGSNKIYIGTILSDILHLVFNSFVSVSSFGCAWIAVLIRELYSQYPFCADYKHLEKCLMKLFNSRRSLFGASLLNISSWSAECILRAGFW